jgi:hypothetical protein
MSTTEPDKRPLTEKEKLDLEMSRGQAPSLPPAPPAGPRKVCLDSVGLMAWHGLMAMRSEAQRRLAEADEAERKGHDARLMSLLTHLGALDLMGPENEALGLRIENGKPYLVAVQAQPKDGQS